MIYNLAFAAIDQGKKDIPQYSFDDLIDLQGFILAESEPECAYLISVHEEVFVTDNIAYLMGFISMMIEQGFAQYLEEINIFYSEYETLQDCYDLAVMLQETKPTFYNQ